MQSKTQYVRKKIPTPKVLLRGQRWIVDVMWQGERPRPTFETEDEAKMWAAEQVVRMQKGEPLAAPSSIGLRTGPASFWTMQHLFDHTAKNHWLVNGPGGGPCKSWDKIEITCKQIVGALGPTSRVAKMDVRYIEEKLRKLQEQRGNTPRTTNRRIAYLSVMLKEAVRQGVLSAVPPLKKAPERTEVRDFRITPTLEREMLLRALAAGDLDLYDFIVLSLHLGQRRNEILKLRLSECLYASRDPHIDGEIAFFPASSHKNKSTFSRSVPLRPIVKEVIERRRAQADRPDDRVLSVTDQAISKRYYALRDELIAESHPDIMAQHKPGTELGEDFCGHIMRNEFATRLAEAGFDEADILKHTGHMDVVILRRYIKPHKIAARMNLLRTGKIDGMLPGGEVPDFAPTKPVFAPKVGVDKPKVDPSTAVKMIEALMAAGMGDMLKDLLAKNESKVT